MKNVILTGEVKSMEPNDKEGLSIRVRSLHGDGKGSNLEFFDVYGNYAKALKEKNVLAVGDIVSVSYEEKQVQKIDPETGTPGKWVTYKDGINFKRTYRPTSTENVNPQVESATGLDTETF